MTIKPVGGDRQLDVAVVGSGIAGLSAAWLLSQNHNVTVFEQNDYPGGHSNTVDVSLGGESHAVDTGFIVYNPVNYPNLVALFDHLGVASISSDMSFSASLSDCRLEYAGTDLNGLFAQRRNLVRPRYYRMLRDLARFYRAAPELVNRGLPAAMSLGEFLRQNRYGDAFIHDHLLPMGAAIWSSSMRQMLEFPALQFLRFFTNHGLVQLTNRPEWRTVAGGSREYVKKLSSSFGDRIHLGDPVTRIQRGNGRVHLTTTAGKQHSFEHVVMACHSDESLALLAEPSRQENRLLGAVRYQPNTAILHTDARLMPKRRRAWASWNYIGSLSGSSEQRLCVTYWMNLLQSLETPEPLFVTLNPTKPIDESRILRRFNYAHPLFDRAAMQAQPELWQLQGKQNTWFCGAWFGYGFHEDGIQSGLAVAELLGGRQRPWQISASGDRINYLSAASETPRYADLENAA